MSAKQYALLCTMLFLIGLLAFTGVVAYANPVGQPGASLPAGGQANISGAQGVQGAVSDAEPRQEGDSRSSIANQKSIVQQVAVHNPQSPKAGPFPTCGPGSDYVVEASNGGVIVPGTSLVPNSQCDECVVNIALPFAYSLYNQSYASINASANGNIQFNSTNAEDYNNTCLPAPAFLDTIFAYWDDLLEIKAGGGIFISTSGSAPNRIFNIEWRGVQNAFGHNPINFEVRLYEGQDRFDIIYGTVSLGGNSATVAVQRGSGGSFTQVECNMDSLYAGLKLTFRTLGCAEPTFTPTVSPTPLPTCGPDSNYTVSQSTGVALVPGIALVPNSQCDDCVAIVALPFAYTLYGQSFNNVNVSSNGNIQFGSVDDSYENTCLPTADLFSYAILPYWDDLETNNPDIGGEGIYTSVSGSAPNRIFNIEWRADVLETGNIVNFEVRLYEGQSRADFIYGAVTDAGMGATIGIENNTGSRYTSYSCNQASVQQGLQVSFVQNSCSANSPTPTATRTATATATATASANKLVGHVLWQGHDFGSGQSLPLTLTLKSGAIEVNYPQQTTDASGFFTVSVGSLASGTYGWRVKGPYGAANASTGPGFLATAGTLTLTGAPLLQVDMGTQKGGDADGNNAVNLNDFTLLKFTYGKSFGDSGYDGRADVDGNNTIDLHDFTLLKFNYGALGAGEIRPFQDR